MRRLRLLAPLALLFSLPAAATTITVAPGGPVSSIQEGVDLARPGDTVAVEAGTYHEAGRPCPTDASHTCAVVVTTDDVRLVGRPRGNAAVVLENAGGQDQGIAIARAGASGSTCLTNPAERVHGATVVGLTVNGFEGEGIFLFCVDDWLVDHCAANDNGEYGIFPSHCGPGRVTGSVATGANDTGIYIGQSASVRVDHNLATGNVSGFEIENSTGVRLDHNVATGNTGGILSFTLPFLDVKQNAGNEVDHNLVQANNKANTCIDPTDAVCAVPPGTGILLLAADDNTIHENTVTGNDSFGIAVTNFCAASGIPDSVCAMLDIEPNSDGTRVEHNVVKGNGDAPAPAVPPPFAVDLAWDGTGSGNCWGHNMAGTQFPAPLPTCR